MDDQTLTYDVLRDNNTWVYSTTGDSNFWTLPSMGFIDKNLAAGSTHKYQVRITDPTATPVEPDLQHRDRRQRVAERLRAEGHRRRGQAPLAAR